MLKNKEATAPNRKEEPIDLGSNVDSNGGDLPLDRGIECILDEHGNLSKVVIFKPNDMSLVKWEKKIISITKGFGGLGVKVRRMTK